MWGGWRTVAVVWVVALLVPSANLLLFDGVPLSSLVELVALLLVVLVLVSTRARAQLRGIVVGRGGCATVVAAVGVAVILAKLLLLAAPAEGFAACYTNPISPRAHGACERSYENLLHGDITRYDQAISFGPTDDGGDRRLLSGSDWNLSFVNDTRLNIYRKPGKLDIERLPFAATWRGDIDGGDGGTIKIAYRGEGRVQIGEHSVRLPPRYRHEAIARVRVDAGDQPLHVSYRFDDRYRVGAPGPRGEYATLRVGDVGASDPGAQPLEAAAPALGWRALGLLTDVALGTFAVVLLLAYALALRRSRWVVAAAVAAGLVAWALESNVHGFGPAALPVTPSLLVIAGLFAYLVLRRPRDVALIGVPAAMVFAIGRAAALLPSLDAVLFRSRGDDWQTYQSFGRAILESGSLEGGEKVFYYQPGFRYLVFAGHLLVGDGDALPAVLGIAAVIGAVFLLAHLTLRRVTVVDARRLLFVVAGVALLVLLGSTTLVALTVLGISEYPTWALLFVVLPLLFLPATGSSSEPPSGSPSKPPTWRWVLGTAALASCVVIRPNQGIPAVFVLGVFVLLNWRRARGPVIAAGAVFVVILLLPALHNVWYGSKLELLPTGASSVRDLSLHRLPDVFSDAEVRRILRDKAAGLTYLSPSLPRETDLGMAVLALQAAWLLAVAGAFVRRRSVSWVGWCLLAWPLTFAVHSVAYDITIYYPRHIIAMYVAAGAVVLFLTERGYPSRAAASQVEVGASDS